MFVERELWTFFNEQTISVNDFKLKTLYEILQ